MKNNRQFLPTEIIFAATSECNLKCAHCFVPRTEKKLDAECAASFLKNCIESDVSSIERIGFSGGEPFLYPQFICKISRVAVENDLLFGRIMTNGIWWKNAEQLKETLRTVSESGFDGKIGLSFDALHNQPLEKISVFIEEALRTFGAQSVEIQSVICTDAEKDERHLETLRTLAEQLGCKIKNLTDRRTQRGALILEGNGIYLPVFRERQSFPPEDGRAWQSRRWFKDDFCAGPGHILYVHPDGMIAPCCGFANENKSLFIGTIQQPLETILRQAEQNEMVRLCFTDGLSSQIRALQKQGVVFPGRTDDICTFCGFVCNHIQHGGRL